MDTTDRIYKFIQQYIDAHGFSPSYDDIRAGAGVASKSVVEYHLHKLEAQGRITRAPEIARSVRVVEETA